ncbi:23S rRNA (adenine(2030)-N(6))-methyltransferase RlmJ [Isoalcanivorax indicus]|uniref:23S rRNA (adenine(2030)-N(6))-methyltransferase RlmJ n=1 Tax=Isoalcanivorax indicus TaxID=2202653 RepID=UPI000DB98866|nr:23S rRNA (adenine(2030)-N(6))-methyltransferase RlmJ [Isoalcanivorax indicus]
MLSYQHGYHAGNIADVHKHVMLSRLLRYLQRKPTPFAVLDLYAGRGHYDLQDDRARKTGEAEQGILRQCAMPEWPALLAPYAEALWRVNGALEGEGEGEGEGAVEGQVMPPRALRYYPGSPLIARYLSPPDCPVICNELHPAEHDALAGHLKGCSGVHLHRRDALEALIALVPPAQRRGLIVLDPSFERPQEYAEMAAALVKAWQRWPIGVYMLWYPLLADQRHRPMINALRQQVGAEQILQSELQVRTAGAGMHGSGVLVINPPWVLADELQALQPWFGNLCAAGPGTGLRLVES